MELNYRLQKLLSRSWSKRASFEREEEERSLRCSERYSRVLRQEESNLREVIAENQFRLAGISWEHVINIYKASGIRSKEGWVECASTRPAYRESLYL